MDIFLMRHGTTVWNEKGISQGRTNNRLSSAGKQLAEKVAKEYKDKNFEVIFTSPLMRTMQTTNIMNKYHHAKVIKNDKLIEIEQGIFTGKSKFNLSEEQKLLKLTRAASCGMESYESVYARCLDFVKFIKNSNYSSLLIVTHNVVASIIEKILIYENNPIDFNNCFNFKNAEVKHFKI